MIDFFTTQPQAILSACLVTITLTLVSSLLGTGVGVLIWLFSRGLLARIAYPILDGVRAVPNLIWIFAVFYFPFRVFSLPVPDALTSAAIGLSISQAAQTADTLRAAYAQIPVQQLDGLAGIGASQRERYRLVVFPNLFRLSWAPHIAFWIGNLKLSSLASVIGVPDLAFVARVTMANTFHSIEAWASVAVVYVILTIPLAFIGRLVERLRYFKQ